MAIELQQCECRKEIFKIIKDVSDLVMIVEPEDLVCKKHHRIPQKLIINLVFDREHHA